MYVTSLPAPALDQIYFAREYQSPRSSTINIYSVMDLVAHGYYLCRRVNLSTYDTCKHSFFNSFLGFAAIQINVMEL